MHAGECNLWAVPQPRPSTGARWADSDAAEGAGEGGLQSTDPFSGVFYSGRR